MFSISGQPNGAEPAANFLRYWLPVLGLLLMVCLPVSARVHEGIVRLPPAMPVSQYWTNAQKVHEFSVSHLLTPYHGYRIQTNSPTAYAWYNVSQIYADAAMVAAGDADSARGMNDTFVWLNHLWEPVPPGGYWAAANIDGSHAAGSGQYVDDNALIGNVFLDAYEVSAGAIKTNYLNSAMATANWLMFSGQWDGTFGGGFWWSTARQNKPTQSNGLAMQLFLRLYRITGQTYYRDWANSVKNWLETRMYNPQNGLYVWQITTNGTAFGACDKTVFTYDNAIMIEADLLYYQVMSNPDYLARAQQLARHLNAVLWDGSQGCYRFNTADARVNPCWCGWASQSLIKLHQADGNFRWLKQARRNLDYMNSHLRNSQGGYYMFCNLDGSHPATNQMEGVDQAWMQRTQALISKYY